MTQQTKNIQDVVAETVSLIVEMKVHGDTELEEDVKATLTQLVKEVEARERERVKKLLSMREASPRSDFDSDEEYQLHRQKIGAINWHSRLIKGQIDLPDLPETNYEN